MNSVRKMPKEMVIPIARTRKMPEVSDKLKERTGFFFSLASLFDVTIHLSTLGTYCWSQWRNKPLSHNTLSLIHKKKNIDYSTKRWEVIGTDFLLIISLLGLFLAMAIERNDNISSRSLEVVRRHFPWFSFMSRLIRVKTSTAPYVQNTLKTQQK